MKQGLDLLIREAVDEARLAERGLASLLSDLSKKPLEIFVRTVAPWKDIDRVLDGDRAETLQASADLHAEIVRLGRDLVNEDEPACLGCVGHRTFQDEPRVYHN